MLFPLLAVAKASMSMPYKTIRENFTHQCAVILSCYRKHCSSHSPVGQLILPDTLKLLPMYANCMLKNDALLSREWDILHHYLWQFVSAIVSGSLFTSCVCLSFYLYPSPASSFSPSLPLLSFPPPTFSLTASALPPSLPPSDSHM